MKGKILCLLLLLLATTANLSSHLLTDDNLLTTWLEQISKPLLIPSLIGYLWFSIPNRSQQSFLLLVLALFFAWIGDILLLGGEQEFLFFLCTWWKSREKVGRNDSAMETRKVKKKIWQFFCIFHLKVAFSIIKWRF